MENGQTCTPSKCGWVHCLATTLLIVGGLNWGLVGALDFNLVTYLVGAWPMVEMAVYILVGVAALVVGAKKLTRCCRK